MGANPMQTSPSEEPRSNKLQGWVTLVLTVVVALIIALYIGQHVQQLETFIGEMGVLGPIISIALQTMFGASPIPTEPLTMINGIVFGPLKGTLFSWIGYMLASMIEYWIGMHLSHIADFEQRREKLPLGLGKFPADSPWFLMLARIVPG